MCVVRVHDSSNAAAASPCISYAITLGLWSGLCKVCCVDMSLAQIGKTRVPVILQPAHATTTLNNPMQPSRCNPMQPYATPMQPSCNPSATLAINLCILIGNPRSAIRRINSCMSRTRGHVARCNPGSTDPDSDATIVAGYSIRCNPFAA